MKSSKKGKKILCLLVTILILIILIFVVYYIISGEGITRVKRVLPLKYDEIKCIDTSCSAIVAKRNDVITLINGKGKKVARYKENTNIEPYQVSNEYFLSRKITDNTDENEYYINDKTGKKIYTTKNFLEIFNNDYILQKNDEKYSILNKQGKEIYSNITEIKKYLDGEYIYLKIGNEDSIVDNKLNNILSNYKIEKLINDKYFILKNTKEDVFCYFSIKNKKIILNNFESYKENNDGTIVVTKRENNEENKYILKENGKLEKKENITQVQIINKIKEKIDNSKYYIYTVSIKDENVKNILVDNKQTNEFGVLNIDNNKFNPLYSYTKSENYYSTINKLNSENENYYQIVCNIDSCSNIKVLIYDVDKSEILYKNENQNLIIQLYKQYADNYKVIKYSSNSNDDKYKDKYVLYNDKNEEILSSNNEIVVVDKILLYGDISSKDLVLYNSKNNKILNGQKSAQRLKLGNKVFYKYLDDNNFTIILDDKSEEIVKSNEKNIKYTDDNIVYLDGNNVNVYDINTSITKTYRLEKNEEITDYSNNIISAYNGGIFINNKEENYIKVINKNGKLIKKINKVQLNYVYNNEENNNVFIIVKRKKDLKTTYGLYLAK